MINVKEILINHPRADKTTIKRIEQVHPKLREEVYCIYLNICNQVSTDYVRVRFSSILRTFKEQDELYEQGRSKSGKKVTWVRGGGSYHNYGLAIDIVLLRDLDKNGSFETASWDTVFDGDLDGIADWSECASIFEAYGWQWGLRNKAGRRYDLPHFQKTLGFSTSQLKSRLRDINGYPIL